MMKMLFVQADHVVDIGPGAGVHGGYKIVAEGTPADIEAHDKSLTGQYLSGKLKVWATALTNSYEILNNCYIFKALIT